MRHVPLAEFEKYISEFVDAAQTGEEIVVMQNGRPMVRLVPSTEEPSTEEDVARVRRDALMRSVELREELRAQGMHVTREEVREWIDEGRP